jgi:nucleoside 2-deoxyribosyltransferase
MPLAYISGPLNNVPDIQRAREFYEAVAEMARAAGFDAYVPHQYTDPVWHTQLSDADVFEKDVEQVRNADVVVAAIGLPSSGVGAEIAIAFAAHTPIVAFWHEDERPSRFILGMLSRAPMSIGIEYSSIVDLNKRLYETLRRVLHRGSALAELMSAID